MVTPHQPTAADAIANWQKHVDGKPQYDPPVPPLAPAKFTGSLWLAGRTPAPEWVDFENSLQKSTGDYVQTVTPNGAGTTHGMLGHMFWAAECQGTRTGYTMPDYASTCEGAWGSQRRPVTSPSRCRRCGRNSADRSNCGRTYRLGIGIGAENCPVRGFLRALKVQLTESTKAACTPNLCSAARLPPLPNRRESQ